MHLLYLPVILCLLGMVVGTYYYPTWIGLGVVVPYYTYILLLDRSYFRTGAPWDAFRRHFLLFAPARKFLNLRLVGNQKLEKMETASTPAAPQYILGVFPHGLNADFRILADGLLSTVLPRTASKVRTLAATVLSVLPVVREMAMWTGCVDACKPVAKRCLKAGLSLYIFPGGQQEQLRTTHGRELCYLQRRKGFCKLALESGVPLVPVYVFGASDLYQTSSFCLNLRLAILRWTGISWTMGRGHAASPYCPLAVDTTMVLGEPIMVQKVERPTPEQVDKLHAEFVTALQQLFDQHRASLGHCDRALEIL